MTTESRLILTENDALEGSVESVESVERQTVPQATLPTTVPQSTLPTTVPQATLPTTAPQATLPTTTPQSTLPTTVPQATPPTTAPQAMLPTTTPQAMLPTTALPAYQELAPPPYTVQPAQTNTSCTCHLKTNGTQRRKTRHLITWTVIHLTFIGVVVGILSMFIGVTANLAALQGDEEAGSKYEGISLAMNIVSSILAIPGLLLFYVLFFTGRIAINRRDQACSSS